MLSQVCLNLIFLFMEITVDGSRKTSKRKRCCHLVFQSHSLQKENCKITFLSHVKMFCVACTPSLGINTSQWQMKERFLELGLTSVKAKRLGILIKLLLMPQKESLFLVVLPMVSKFCLTKYHTAIS